MDKIEFFPIDAGSRGGGSKGQRGSRCGEDEGGGSEGGGTGSGTGGGKSGGDSEGWRGRGGDSGGRGQGHRLRRARHWRWTAGGSRERATAEVRGKKSGKKRCNSGKTVNFVLSFANNKGFD